MNAKSRCLYQYLGNKTQKLKGKKVDRVLLDHINYNQTNCVRYTCILVPVVVNKIVPPVRAANLTDEYLNFL